MTQIDAKNKKKIKKIDDIFNPPPLTHGATAVLGHNTRSRGSGNAFIIQLLLLLLTTFYLLMQSDKDYNESQFITFQM